MSRSEARGPLATLSVEAADIATEIFIIGESHDVRASGVAALRAEVPAGACRVKFRAADEMATVMADLRPGATTELEGRAVAFPSPLPLDGESQPARVQREAAERQSKSAPLGWGKGARLLLFLRRADGAGVVPAELCRVSQAEGGEVATLAAAAGDATSGSRGLSLSVQPGVYRVQFDEGAGRRAELSVAVAAGWTTLVFGVVHASEDGAAYVRMDEVAVQAWPQGRPLRLDAPALRVAELSRLALLRGRMAVAESVLTRGVWLAEEAPMGLVYAIAAVLGRRSRARVRMAKRALAALDEAGFRTPETLVLRARLESTSGRARRPKAATTELLLVANSNWMLRHHGGKRSGVSRRGSYVVRVDSQLASAPTKALGAELADAVGLRTAGSFASAFRKAYALLHGSAAVAPAALAVPESPLEAYVYAAASAPLGMGGEPAEDATALARRARQVADAIPVPAAQLAAAAERLVGRMS